jgi:hypothetical protein
MNEETHRLCDVVLKTVAALGLAVGGVIGVGEFLNSAARDSQKPFLEKQLAFCAEASSAAATFATAAEPSARAKAKDLFLDLYWGRLGIVEDVRVASAMIAYKTKVIDIRGSTAEAPQFALNIAHACRDLSLAAWRIKLPESVQLPR